VKVKLLCQDPLASPREITLDCLPAELGRGPSAALRIDDRWISRRHCELKEVAGTLVVRDLGSRHGTFVNGRPVIADTPLMPGDELCVGLSHFLTYYDHAGLPYPTVDSLHTSSVLHEA
jgi:pSer/pThr/pTyr-binding forkhead associated (FHA) protein